jgi:CRISPR/Cas system-associated exonuclease Cas4 (RecB family)
MEPLTATALAIGTVIATKAVEKIGENVGDAVSEKTRKFLASLKHQSPNTATAIELAPEQPLDYGQAVLEVESAVEKDTELNQMVQELAAAAEANSNQNLAEELRKVLRDIEEALKSQQPSIQNQNLAKLQEKGIINQGVIHNQHNTF